MTLTDRKMRQEALREHQKLVTANERARLTLEVPLMAAREWHKIIVEWCTGKRGPLPDLSPLESLIRKAAAADWGPGTMVFFKRKPVPTVVIAHADGRRVQYPVERKPDPSSGKSSKPTNP